MFCICFGFQGEEYFAQVHTVKTFEIKIGTIHDVECACIQWQYV